jgi:hypothetical protein
LAAKLYMIGGESGGEKEPGRERRARGPRGVRSVRGLLLDQKYDFGED